MLSRTLRSLSIALVLAAPVAASAQTVSLHGSLSQTVGAEQDAGIFQSANYSGIKTRTDFRRVDLTASANLSDESSVTVRVATGSLDLMGGNNSITSIDRAFYQRNIEGTRVRFGKTPVAFGFANESREDGTAQAFAVAPQNFYSGVMETVNGVAAARSFGTLALDGFVGQDVGFKTAMGIQANLPTIANITLNGGAIQAKTVAGDIGTIYNVGAKGSYKLLSATAELRHVRGDSTQTYYVQSGYAVAERVTLNGQVEITDRSANHDAALGVNFRESKNVAFKLEGHTVKGAPNAGVASMAKAGNYVLGGIALAF